MSRSRVPRAVVAASVFLVLASFGSARAVFEEAEHVGAWPFGPAGALAFDPARNLAFVGEGGVVVVVDISDPGAPVEVSDGIRTRGRVEGVAFDPATSVLVIADGEPGIEIWDVQDAAAPARLGSRVITRAGAQAPAMDVAVWSHFAYVSAGFGYLHVIDFSNPSNPLDIGFDGQGGDTGSVYLAGSTLYVSGGQHLVRYALQADGGLQLTGLNQYSTVGTPYVAGNYLYGTRNGYFLVVDASQSQLPVIAFIDLDNPRDVTVVGSIAYVADVTAGLLAIDVSNPSAPFQVGGDPSVGVGRVEQYGGDLFTTGSTRFRALDLATPTAPSEIGSLASASSAYDVDLAGGYAYVADASRGLYVLDVSDPGAPVLVGRADSPGAALDLVVEGGYAYVATQFEGLTIYDVRDPAAPVQVANQPTPYYARGVSVDGGIAYVSDLTGGLRVIDVSDPGSPAEIGSAALSGASHADVGNGVAYVASGSTGLGVVDVSDPSMPVVAATIPLSDFATGVDRAGDHLFVADFGGGLRILDVSSPLSPVPVSFWTQPGLLVSDVRVVGDLAYVTDAGEAVWIVDVSDPVHPIGLATYDTPGDAFRVAVSGSDLFVADGATGIQVGGYGAATPAPPVAAAATATRVAVQGGTARFLLPDGRLALNVYDVLGRRVFSSRDRQEVRFAPAASGAYFWRVDGDGARETGKVVLVR